MCREPARTSAAVLAALVALVALAGLALSIFSTVWPASAAAQQGDFRLISSAFEDGGAIPSAHTCAGGDTSPPLVWLDPPPETESFALVMSDPDTPDPRAPKLRWVHWVVYDLPAGTRRIANVRGAEGLPAGAVTGKNDWNRAEYEGPCPAFGRHRIEIRLLALDVKLGDRGPLREAELMRAVRGHVLAEATLSGSVTKR